MTVFVDTSAIVALLDVTDPLRASTVQAFDDFLDAGPLVTHSHVATETIAVLQRKGGLDAVREYVLGIEPTLEITWVDEPLHRAALADLLSRDRNAVSLVDCVSFEVMRRLGIETALTLDHDFRDEGFAVVP